MDGKTSSNSLALRVRSTGAFQRSRATADGRGVEISSTFRLTKTLGPMLEEPRGVANGLGIDIGFVPLPVEPSVNKKHHGV